MDILGRFLAAGNIEVASARRARADENRIPAFGQQRLHAVDALAAAEIDAEAEDVAGFLVDDGIRQTEFRNLRADHSARFWIAVEHNAGVAERGEVTRDSEGGGPATDQRDTLAVFPLRGFGQPRGDVVFVVGRTRLSRQIAADRFVLDPHAAARRLARTITGAAEYAGKHIRFAN